MAWIDTQKRTFTGWCNNYLSERLQKVEEITTDFKDGKLLISLVEVLSGKEVKGLNKNPKMKAQFLENVSLALRAIKMERIELVGIGAEDVVDGNLKLILGMVWKLILHYQIAKSAGSAGSPKQILLEWTNSRLSSYGFQISNFTTDWSNGKAICCLTDSFKPGCFPIDSLSGNAVSDINRAIEIAFTSFEIPKIMIAEDIANRPDELSLMTYISFFREKDPSVASTKGGAKAVASQQTSATKSGPSSATGGSHSAQFSVPPGVSGAKNGIAVGELQVFTLEPQTASGELIPVKLEDIVIDIAGVGESFKGSVFDNGDGQSYDIEWTPNKPGTYTITIFIQGRPYGTMTITVGGGSGVASGHGHAQGSHQVVHIEGNAGGVAGQPTAFTVKAGGNYHKDQLTCQISGPDNLSGEIYDNSDGSFDIEWTPNKPGKYSIAVLADGKPVPGSPFTSWVVPNSEYKCSIEGSGASPHNPGHHKFSIKLTSDDGKPISGSPDWIDVEIMSGSTPIKPKITGGSNGVYTIEYDLTQLGPMSLNVTVFGQSIMPNPIRTEIKQGTAGKVTTTTTSSTQTAQKGIQIGQWSAHAGGASFGTGMMTGSFGGASFSQTFEVLVKGQKTVLTLSGAGIRGGQPGEPLLFTLKSVVAGKPTVFPQDQIDVTVNGPEKLTPVILDTDNDGIYEIQYTADEPGVYDLQIYLFGKPVLTKPLKISIGDAGPASASACSFDTTIFQNTKVTTGTPFSFMVYAQGSNGGPRLSGGDNFTVECVGPDGKRIEAFISDNGDGTYTVNFTPSSAGKYSLTVYLNGVKISGCPFSFNVEAGLGFGTGVGVRCVLEGSGLRGGYMGHPLTFNVKAMDLDNNPVPINTESIDVKIKSESGQLVKHKITPNKAGTVYTVEYVASRVGVYTIMINLFNKPILAKPIQAVIRQPENKTIQFSSSASFDQISGLALTLKGAIKRCITGRPNQFEIILLQHGKPATIDASQIGVSIPNVHTHVVDNHNGVYSVVYTPTKVGEHDLDISLFGASIFGKPIKLIAREPDSHKFGLSVGGSGLKSAIVGYPASFTVYSALPLNSEAFYFNIYGPGGTIIPTITDNGDGTFTVSYTPSIPGNYHIQSYLYGTPLFSSPVKTSVTSVSPVSVPNPSKCTITGNKSPKAGTDNTFTITAKDDKGNPVKGEMFTVRAKGPAAANIDLIDNNNGTYEVKYNPVVGGPYEFDVLYRGQPIAGSPFKVTVDGPSSGAAESAVLSKRQVIRIYVYDQGYPKKSGGDNVEVTVSGPNGHIDAEVVDNRNGTYTVEFDIVPGEFKVEAKLNGKHVKGSPFHHKATLSN